jgi:hypothetical protein
MKAIITPFFSKFRHFTVYERKKLGLVLGPTRGMTRMTKTTLPSLTFRIAGALSLLAVSAVPAAAQISTADPGAPQVAGLFEQSCMRFTGNAAGLRAWIASQDLPLVPETGTRFFLGGRRGQVFNASNSLGKYVLASYDDGACKVVVMAADFGAVQQTLLKNLKSDGLTVAPVLRRTDTHGGANQQMYRAALGQFHRLLSITEHPHTDAPDLAPELALIATIDVGTSASEQ